MKIRPLRDLVLVRTMPETTQEGAWKLWVPAGGRNPGYIVAEILAVGPDAHRGLEPRSKVLIEPMSSPDGAPMIDPEALGLPPGEEGSIVTFVHARNLPAPQDAELAKRREAVRRLQAVLKRMKETRSTDFQKKNAFNAELIKHERRVRELLRDKAQARRSRFMRIIDRGAGKAEGVLAVLEG